MKHRIAIALIGMCMALPQGSAPAYAQGADAEEIRLGQVYARRLESQYRLMQDAGVLERVTRIGKIVAAASDRPGLPYTFKVLDLEISYAVFCLKKKKSRRRKNPGRARYQARPPRPSPTR